MNSVTASELRAARLIAIKGQRFGRLVVVGEGPRSVSGRERCRYICRCDCGGEALVRWSSLRAGRSLSCGCLKREMTSARQLRHGMCVGERPAEYVAWLALRSRCSAKDGSDYSAYGGRGIKVSPRWDSFERFFEDMGERPSTAHSVDRINNDGNYEPGNCRWATKKEQGRNTRETHLLTFRGATMCITDWATTLGMSPSGIAYRLRAGWSLEKAMTTPSRRGPRAAVRGRYGSSATRSAL